MSSRALPPIPSAIPDFRRSARQGHDGPFDRCAGGAALAPSDAAPTPHSSHAALETHGKKVSTARCTPGERGYPPLPESSPALAVLTIINERAAFQCLSAPSDIAGSCPLFRLRAMGRSRTREKEA